MWRVAAREAVCARAERVSDVVGRVWDWETARVREGILWGLGDGGVGVDGDVGGGLWGWVSKTED